MRLYNCKVVWLWDCNIVRLWDCDCMVFIGSIIFGFFLNPSLTEFNLIYTYQIWYFLTSILELHPWERVVEIYCNSIEFDPAKLANFISRRSVAFQACFSHQTFFFSWVSRPLSIWHLDNDVSRFTRELLIADKHSYIAHTSMHRMILFSFISFKLIVNLECYCSRNRLYICQSVCSVSSVHMTIHNLFLFVFGCESSPISRNVS